MKTRRTIIMILTLCVALSFTACTGKGDVGKADSSSVSEGTEKTEDLQAKLDDLYQQENEIFEKHKDVWEKVFSKMSKADAGSDNYAEYLASTVESNKNSFTDDELKTLKEDIETIRGIEEQITEVVLLIPKMMIPLLLIMFQEKILMEMTLRKIFFLKMQ